MVEERNAYGQEQKAYVNEINHQKIIAGQMKAVDEILSLVKKYESNNNDTYARQEENEKSLQWNSGYEIRLR